MALTDENGGGMVMPVAPLGYGGGNQGGFGWGGDSLLWVILILCLGGGWGGFGGFGMGGAMMGMGMMGMDYLYPWLNNSKNINDGFRDQMLNTQVNGIQNAVTSGFGDIQTALCGGFAGTTAAINGAQNSIAQQLYTNQISDLERSFAAQTASTSGMNAIQSQLANCCCENRAATADLKYTVATEACADRAAIASALRDVIDATQNQTQTILDKMCQQEIDNLKAQNLALQNQVNMQAMQASQVAQTAALVADNTAQTQYIVNRVAPYPIPAYTVANPVTPATT
jgi:hypothetical protein